VPCGRLVFWQEPVYDENVNVKLAQRISVPLSRKRERACPGLDPGAGVREAVTAHDSFMLKDGKFAMTVSMRKLAIVT
jgi:hypothetical protein